MITINKMSAATPYFKILKSMLKENELRKTKKFGLAIWAAYDFAKQTNVNLLKFYLYNIIQIPVFLIMVLSIRKLSYENEDLAG